MTDPVINAKRKFITFEELFVTEFAKKLQFYESQARPGSDPDGGIGSKILKTIGPNVASTFVEKTGIPLLGPMINFISDMTDQLTFKRNAKLRAMNIVAAFDGMNSETVKSMLLQVGTEMFEKCEYIVTRAVDDLNGSDGAILRLVMDSADRILNHIDERRKSDLKEGKEFRMSGSLLTKGFTSGIPEYHAFYKYLPKRGYKIYTLDENGKKIQQNTYELIANSGFMKYNEKKELEFWVETGKEYNAQMEFRFPFSHENLAGCTKLAEQVKRYIVYKHIYHNNPSLLDEHKKDIFKVDPTIASTIETIQKKGSLKTYLTEEKLKQISDIIRVAINAEIEKEMHNLYPNKNQIEDRFTFLMDIYKMGDYFWFNLPELSKDIKQVFANDMKDSEINAKIFAEVAFLELIRETKNESSELKPDHESEYESYMSLSTKDIIADFVNDQSLEDSTDIISRGLDNKLELMQENMISEIEKSQTYVDNFEVFIDKIIKPLNLEPEKLRSYERDLQDAKERLKYERENLDEFQNRRDEIHEQSREAYEKKYNEIDDPNRKEKLKRGLERLRKGMRK